MHGSQPKLSSVVESKVSWDLFLGFHRLTWENSQNLGTPLLVSPQIDVWKWLQKFHTGNVLCHLPMIWVVLLIAIFPQLTTNQKHYPDLCIGTSTVWNFCSHISDVISQGNQWWCWKMSAVLSGYLTVVQFSWCKVAMQLGVAMWVGTGLDLDPSSCSFPKAPFIWRQVVMGRRVISLQNAVNCLREKQKVGLAWRVTRPARRKGDRIAVPSWFRTFLKNATTHEPNIKGGVSRKFTQIHPLGPTCMNWSPNWAWDVLITAFIIHCTHYLSRGEREAEGKKVPFLLARPGPRVSLAPKTPFPFPFPSKRLPRRLHFPQITHAADSRPAW